MGADPDTLGVMADVILDAKHPIILVDFIGRQPGNFGEVSHTRRDVGLRSLGYQQLTRVSKPASSAFRWITSP